MNRRKFLGTSVAAPAIAQAADGKSAAASDRVRIGVIGCGGMGRMDLQDFLRMGDADVVAVCDVFRANAEAARKLTGGKAEIAGDFRKVIERKDVDAVIVATPDHWHPLITVMACDAGKDVYVEKPVSQNVREGRLMVEAARRNKRVVQVGLQQRSGSHFQRAVKAVQEGRIGSVHYAQCWNHNAGRPGGMDLAETAPPEGLDWEMWIGPAPARPYSPARRNFRWWWDYAGGELTNWCVHLIDIVHWATGKDIPSSVTSSGGVLFAGDARECPDTQEVVWEYPGCLVHYSTTLHNSFGHNGDPGWKPFGSYGILIHGSEGTLFVDRAGYQIYPQMRASSEKVSQSFREAYDDLSGAGMYYRGGTEAERGTTSVQHAPHVRNFLDCVKSRELPAADIEIGHRSTATCLLGNVALRTGEKLRWDGAAERFTNNEKANAMLRRDYRAPWALKGL